MSFRKLLIILLSGLGLFLVAGLALLQPTDAQAQCGSQASSCKNCHEVQGQDPVNSDGTGWHQSHAFGDFCYICHAGNNQSMEKEVAHTGMVPPLSDIKAGCQSCHPNDLNEKAQVYASVLGVSLEGGAAQPAGNTAATGEPGPTPTAGETAGAGTSSGEGAQPAAPAGPVIEDSSAGGTGEVIDYNQRYAETVQDKRPVNWGNLILVILIVVVAVSGGGFVYINERKRRGLPLGKASAARVQPAAGEAPVVEGYPAEVTALLPRIARLNPTGLHALKRILENPDTANELFHSLSKMDPELVNRVRTLDRSSRELLLAMSGD